MPAIKRAKGGWDVAPGRAPGHFERSNGTKMTQDEIAATSTTVTPQEASRISMARIAHERAEAAAQRDKAVEAERVKPTQRPPKTASTILQELTMVALRTHGTIDAAATALGVKKQTLYARMSAMRQAGVDLSFVELASTRPRSAARRPATPKKPARPIKLKPSTEETALIERVRPFVEARAAAIDAAKEPIGQHIDRNLDDEVDRRVAAAAPTAPWRERLEERYIDLLLRRAEEAPADDPVYDRIERLVGMLAP